MQLTTYGALTYGDLSEGDVFLVPLTDAEPPSAVGYGLWRKEHDAYARLHHQASHESGVITWAVTNRYPRQQWPDDTPVLKISEDL